MSWIQKLYETYENCCLDPELTGKDPRLLPVNHISQQAHIEVTLDGESHFIRANLVPKEETILPATEKSSAARTNSASPHPLADKILYCAKDYPDFGGVKKSYFDAYIKQLADWCQSPFAHSKAQIIYNYLNKGRLVADLVEKKVLCLDSAGKLLTKVAKKDGENVFKYLPNGQDQGDALVRWNVEIPGDPNSHTWEDKSLYKAWTDYISSKETKKGVCFVTGEKERVATHHPAKIRNSGDKAKLISANDKHNYTFRGRFYNNSQACEISSEVTQKAHNALRWLIARQGKKNGDQVFVAWACSGKEIPPLLENTTELFEQEISITDHSSSTKEARLYDQAGQDFNQRDIGQTFASKLNKLIAGYEVKLGNSKNIVIMGLDSAVPGRMAITYYQELDKSDFLKRIKRWHSDFSWNLHHFKEKKDTSEKKRHNIIWRVSAPSPKEIAEAAFGTSLDEKLRNATIERLLPCIVENKPIPFDLVKSTIRRAENRMGFKEKERQEWEKILSIACSLFKGYFLRHPDIKERRNYSMALETERNSRDYLFGRLLALAEHIEVCALRIADENRQTNAAKLMQRFADRPYSTWKTIETSLVPYKARVMNKWPRYLEQLKNQIDEVFSLFLPGEFESESCLSGEFLLGYHCQRRALKMKNEISEQPELLTENN